MCEEKLTDLLDDEMDECPVLFDEDIDLLEDRLDDIILAIGLPAEQTNAILRLISDALDEHHTNILDTFEELSDDCCECEDED